MPLERLQIELVNVCNYRCPLCRTLLRDRVRRRRMHRDELRRVIAPVADQLTAITLFGTRGEPYMHPQLEACIADLKRHTRASIDVSTNASLIDADRARATLEAGLDRLIVAVDGLTPETYARYRVGGHLDTVLDNIETFCRLKHQGGYRTRVVFQLIPMASNEHEIPRLPALARRLGVDVARLKISSSVTRDRALRPTQPAYHGRRRDDDALSCPSGLDKVYVDPNGDVYPCCYGEGHRAMKVGNAFDTPLDELYEAAILRRIRDGFADRGDHHPFCVERCASRPASTKMRLPLVS